MASSRLGSTDGFMLAGRMRDRRGQSRGRLGRVVQVAHEGDAAYARCHDFSDTGMKLDLTAPLALNDEVSVALSPSVVLFGRVAWINGDECGIAFDGPVNSAALLEAADGARSAAQARATLDFLNSRQGAVSAAPAKQSGENRSAVKFEPGLAVTVMVGPDHEQRATLRWAQGNIAQLDLAPIDVSRPRGAYPALTGPEAS